MLQRRKLMMIGAAIAAIAGGAALYAVNTPSQAEVAPAAAIQNTQISWDLTEIYPNLEAFEADITTIESEIATLAGFAGTLGNDADSLFKALEASSNMLKRVARAAVYASLKSDENLGSAPDRERSQRGETLFNRLGLVTAYIDPEILTVGAEKIAGFRAANTELDRRFGFYLDNTLRGAAHTLDAEGEAILAAMSDVLSQPSNVYSLFADAEMPFPTVTLSDGTQVKLDQAAYSFYRQVSNRADRKLVFDNFWGAWQSYKGTLGANLASAVIGNVTMARLRHFPNALSASLFANNMPEAVYRTLVQVTNDSLPTLHRYFNLRKRMLGIEGEMGYHDIYPSMVSYDRGFPIAESQALTLAALQPLGADYVGKLAHGFSQRWQHVYPQEGKASGAYVNGWVYDVHPFVLLNHNDDYDSMSTLAHEWGHAVHTMLANEAQPWETARYATFTAETASIANEMFLQDYMVKNAQSREERLYYLGEALEGIRGTYFRQTMFAEFQLAIHEVVERGEPLSGERMTSIYCDLLKRYHGDAEGVVKIDENYCVEWAFIPHFYRGFYVYQYATSIAGAAYLTQDIIDRGEVARETFLNVLRAGGSNYPYELYKQAGLDMASRAPYEALMVRTNRIMDEMEQLLAQPQ